MELFYILFSKIPIITYLFWKGGYNIQKFKIPITISALLAICIYITDFKDYIILLNSQFNLTQKLVFFLLLFFSIVSLIIILSVPNNLKNGIVLNEKIHKSNELNTNINNDTQLDYKTLPDEVKKTSIEKITDENKEIDTKIPDSLKKFKKLINNLFKSQNTNSTD